MNIAQVKAALGLESLPLTRQLDVNGKETAFLSFWNNTTRTRVLIHDDVLAVVRTSQDMTIKTSQKASKESGELYTEHFIIIPARLPEVVL